MVWMTPSIFKEWPLLFDRKMHAECRKVVLLMDNSSSHNFAYNKLRIQFQNTFIICLPVSAHSTTCYQPLEQGNIYTWKANWKRQGILSMMVQIDQEYDLMSTMTVLDAIRWAISAWEVDL